MEGGEWYWIAKISVAGNAAYYCVSETLSGLLRQILEKGQTHFPGLLEVKGINVEISREMLAHTPVPRHIAERAYEKIQKKEVKEAKIPASVSIRADVELTLIVELDDEKVKGFVVPERKVLAKYEILAIAATKNKRRIKDAYIEGKNDKAFWVFTLDNKKCGLTYFVWEVKVKIHKYDVRHNSLRIAKQNALEENYWRCSLLH